MKAWSKLSQCHILPIIFFRLAVALLTKIKTRNSCEAFEAKADRSRRLKLKGLFKQEKKVGKTEIGAIAVDWFRRSKISEYDLTTFPSIQIPSSYLILQEKKEKKKILGWIIWFSHYDQNSTVFFIASLKRKSSKEILNRIFFWMWEKGEEVGRPVNPDWVNFARTRYILIWFKNLGKYVWNTFSKYLIGDRF